MKINFWKKRINQLDSELRTRNIILLDIGESDHEYLKNKIINIIKWKLDIALNEYDLEEVYRIGKGQDSKIQNFLSIMILQKKIILWGKRCYRTKKKHAIAQGNKVAIYKVTLIINGTISTLDDLKNYTPAHENLSLSDTNATNNLPPHE